ncbi:hypothetical protein [Actimicrobium sp. CCI2.3]|uniref:hypothetical protein n=1 Tax=Actimicrobium sp. CCI2.3 TaxID=3048616 RepID=UPI002AB5D000|nr:hypothetical protein [Actimicrobium sp. CCI2.3]MDY7574497.1 hypothetical protein [Actimicrobium sp. CCI2.3]MEB0023924.1 hypothetical protein [Actimicrobium sp. CCI2.3]
MNFFHSFNFNTGTDAKVYGHPEIDVLDYEYGSSHQFATRPAKEEWEMHAAAGRDSFGSGGLAGMMPRGEYLYVKWRVKATGEVLEDKVDLKRLLPTDMTNFGLHFAIYGSQLYVYLFPPYTTKDALGETVAHGGREPVGTRGQTLLDIPYAQQHQIYPDLKK